MHKKLVMTPSISGLPSVASIQDSLENDWGLPMSVLPQKTLLLKPASFFKDFTTLPINWGSPFAPWGGITYNMSATSFAHKKNFFYNLKDSAAPWIPELFFSLDSAQKYLDNPAFSLVARTANFNSAAKNTVLLQKGDAIPNASFYTGYIKKSSEYRVHFFRNPVHGLVLFTQKKKLLSTASITEVTYKIRNLKNGWVYGSENYKSPSMVSVCAEQLTKIPYLKELTFGAFDIIYNKEHNSAYCLGYSPAPGLSKEAAYWYAKNIADIYECNN